MTFDKKVLRHLNSPTVLERPPADERQHHHVVVGDVALVVGLVDLVVVVVVLVLVVVIVVVAVVDVVADDVHHVEAGDQHRQEAKSVEPATWEILYKIILAALESLP